MSEPMAAAPNTPPDVPSGPAPVAEGSCPRFREAVLASGVVDPAIVDAAEAQVRALPGMADPDAAGKAPAAFDRAVAQLLVKRGDLTDFQANQLLLGRKKLKLGQYRILDQIGRGGMGLVFLAEHDLMGRRVAVKVLPRKKSTEESEMVFRREIRMLGRLDHDNLVRALDAGYDGKVFFLVTELVPGIDLNKQIKRHGILDELTATSVISQVATVLAYAHTNGVIHRDVKPGNIIVTKEGRVKLLDLGLAGSMLADEALQLNRIVGTMDYIAPEQLKDPDNVGPSADIYSLGCTLYFTVTGQPLFPGGTRQDKAKRHLHEKPPSVSERAPHLSKPFCNVIEGMLLKEPSDRYRSMEEVIEALETWRSAELLPMPQGQEPAASVEQISETDPEAEFLNDSVPGDSGKEWALGDADSVSRPGDLVVEPPGREDDVTGGDDWPRAVVAIAAKALAAGLAGGLATAALAATGGVEASGLIATAVIAGLMLGGIVAGGLTIARVLQDDRR